MTAVPLTAADAIEHQRRRLLRGYEYVTEFRLRHLGYRSPHDRQPPWRLAQRFLQYQFLTHYWASPPSWRLLARRWGGRRTLPDFCVIGPIKSGTSDLAVGLLLHPNVMVPLVKEFSVLDVHPERWRICYPTERQRERHAQRHGSALSPFVAPYLHSMELTYNLAKTCPNNRIVLTLREPASRVFSQWKWEVFLAGNGRARELPFLATFRAYAEWALDVFPVCPMYTRCGFQPLQTSIYWKAVSYWIECFGRENVLVLDVGDYFRDRDSFLRTVYEFVGLPHVPMRRFDRNVNENPISVPPADAETMAMLRRFFAPYNEELWNVISTRFDW